MASAGRKAEIIHVSVNEPRELCLQRERARGELSASSVLRHLASGSKPDAGSCVSTSMKTLKKPPRRPARRYYYVALESWRRRARRRTH